MNRTVVSMGATLALVACNMLSGAADLEVCSGETCVGASASEGGSTGGLGPVVVLPPSEGGVSPDVCVEGSKRCEGRSLATCQAGAWIPTRCEETCASEECAPWPSCRSSTDVRLLCGADGKSCCESKAVPGGTFQRRSSELLKATVSPFELDRFEVTVARFRLFMSAGAATKARPPAAGVGVHPRIVGSGWQPTWNGALPTTVDDLRTTVGGGTWTNEPGANELKPITNVPWLVAFAFCAWDGGRLPTYAEWAFAAAGGDEQRVYPWSSPPENATIAPANAAYSCGFTSPAYTCPAPYCTSGGASPCNPLACAFLLGVCQPRACFGCEANDIANVGSLPDGAGRWGHLDLAGNASELLLDSVPPNGGEELEAECRDCAPLMGPDPYGVLLDPNDDYKVFLAGGGWNAEPAELLTSAYRTEKYDYVANNVGFRCARDEGAGPGPGTLPK